MNAGGVYELVGKVGPPLWEYLFELSKGTDLSIRAQKKVGAFRLISADQAGSRAPCEAPSGLHRRDRAGRRRRL
jgi:hypothetical protein